MAHNKIDMKQITIGDKPLMQISPEDLLELAVILGACPCLDYWNRPEIIRFCNTLFSDTIYIIYNATRIKDGMDSEEIVFYFHTNRLGYHYHREREGDRNICDRLSIEAIKYLIEKGYNVPIY